MSIVLHQRRGDAVPYKRRRGDLHGAIERLLRFLRLFQADLRLAEIDVQPRVVRPDRGGLLQLRLRLGVFLLLHEHLSEVR